MSEKKPGIAIMLGIGGKKPKDEDEEDGAEGEGMSEEIAAEVWRALKEDDEEAFKQSLVSLVHSCEME